MSFMSRNRNAFQSLLSHRKYSVFSVSSQTISDSLPKLFFRGNVTSLSSEGPHTTVFSFRYLWQNVAVEMMPMMTKPVPTRAG